MNVKITQTKYLSMSFLNHNKYSTDIDLLIIKISRGVEHTRLIVLVAGIGFRIGVIQPVI